MIPNGAAAKLISAARSGNGKQVEQQLKRQAGPTLSAPYIVILVFHFRASSSYCTSMAERCKDEPRFVGAPRRGTGSDRCQRNDGTAPCSSVGSQRKGSAHAAEGGRKLQDEVAAGGR